MRIKNSVNSLTSWRGFLFLALLAWLSSTLLKTTSRRKKMNTINDIGKKVYLLLLENGFHYKTAQYITAQAAHESANFTSKVFIQNNNCFGMRDARLRKNKQIGIKNTYGVYASLEDCIEDYTHYWAALKYLSVYSSVSTFVQALKAKRYFEAPVTEYENGVTHFFNLYFA